MANFEINEEYFSGSQASIFVGDIWVDDIVDWQCSVGANAMPIYGYGSTFYDRAVQGRVLVQGSLTINFREPNYLFAILARYRHFSDLNLTEQTTKSPLLQDLKLQEIQYQDKRKSLDEFFYTPNKKTKWFDGPVYDTITKNNTLDSNISKDQNNFAIPEFDIKIGYGATIDENTIGEKILGVKLVGKGKVIMANGEPIKETYNFFARNVV